MSTPELPNATPRRLRAIHARLAKALGPLEPPRAADPLDELILTVLSQHTSDLNAERAYGELRTAYPTWQRVVDSPSPAVADVIRSGGLANTKAPRIQAILRAIKADRGRIDIQHLADMDEQLAYDYLVNFKGVGPKTANCVLLFAFKHAVFPVDTHIHRIARRLKLIGPKTTAEQAHDVLKPMVRPKDRYEMHVLLIEHGRRTCRAINPRCGECALRDLCPYGLARQASSSS